MALNPLNLEVLLRNARDDEWMSSLSLKYTSHLIGLLANKLQTFIGHYKDDHYSLILELIATLLSFYDRAYKRALLRSTSCLETVFELFHSEELDFSIAPRKDQEFENLIDIMLIAITENDIEEQVAELVIKKVIQMIGSWVNGHKYLRNCRVLLKKLLFLGKSVVFRSCSRQKMFLKFGGLQVIMRCLQEPYEWNVKDSCLKSPGIAPLDAPRSLFSSISWLLDAVLIHNQYVCMECHKIGITATLLASLETVPKKELEGAISCLIHILETNVCEFSHVEIGKIYSVTQAQDFKRHDLGQNLTAFITKYHANTTPKVASSGEGHKMREVPHASKCKPNPARKMESSCEKSERKGKEREFSEAEIMLFLLCVNKFGVNMEDIRKVYPFHPDMTPSEMYIFWRGLWDLPT